MKKILFSILAFAFILFFSVALNADGEIDNPIIANKISGTTPLIVELRSTLTDSELDYSWTLPNGELIYSRDTTQIFRLPGEYSVTLTTVNNTGGNGVSEIQIIALDEPNCSGDYDEDGFDDCADLCPLISGGELNQGCPVFEESCDANCGCDDGYVCNYNGNQSTCSTEGLCLPEKPEESCYYQAEKNYLFGNAVCNSCPCANKLEYNAKIRMCDILFPAVTSPNKREIYERGGFFEVK